jgi:hypothetical protein
MTETQERFLRLIAERIPLERIAEVHLFPPIRQGGVETGIAVIAAIPEGSGERNVGGARGELPTNPADVSADGPAADPTRVSSSERHTVFSARYRLALRGAERGNWEADVVAEADAPLVTVDAVVRGVQRRSGEGAEPERLTAATLRLVLGIPAGDATGAASATAPATATPTRACEPNP